MLGADCGSKKARSRTEDASNQNIIAMTQYTSHVDMKVVLLGKEFCGKTSLVERFINERFIGENRYQNTIGAAYGARNMEGTKRNGKTEEIMVRKT